MSPTSTVPKNSLNKKKRWNFLLFEKNGGMPSLFVHCSPILWKRFGFAEVPRKAAPRKGQNEAGCLLVGTNPAPGPIPYCMQYDSQNVRYPNHYTQRVGILIVKPGKNEKKVEFVVGKQGNLAGLPKQSFQKLPNAKR